MATVTVRGEAVVPGTPDEVRVWLALSATGERPENAYDEVAARSAVLDSVFVELGIDAAARSTAGVSVEEHFEYGPTGTREQRGYRAWTRQLVRVADPVLVSRLLREAVARADAHVEGPSWQIARDNPARAEARRHAALDARTRADTYAQALGARLGAIVSVAEPGTTQPSERSRGIMTVADEIAVQPGELDVHAAVEVTFALEQA